MRVRTLLVTLLVLVGGAASAAVADDHLVRSEPAANEVLLRVPTRVALELTPGTQVCEVAVTDSTGADRAAGDPVQDGTKVAVALDAAWSAGTYRIEWHAVTGSGEQISGEVPFTLAPAALAAPQSAQPDVADIGRAARAAEPGLPWARTVIVSVLGAVVSLVAVPRLVRWRTRRIRAADPVEQALRASGGFEVSAGTYQHHPETPGR